MADEIVKKYKVHRVSGVNSDGSAKLETVHPETEAGQVLYTGTIGTTDVANVDQALGALATLAQNSGVTSVNGQTGAVTLDKTSIGLGKVDNTSDAEKPVSTAQAAAIKVVQDQVTKLVGSDTNKSARTIANEELAKQLIPSTAQDALDTLEEIAQWIQAHPESAAAMNAQIEKIIVGTTAVGNASQLGGIAADQYALKTAIPSSELFVIRCNLNGAVVESFDETFNDISSAMANGVVPILFVYSSADDYREPTPFYFQYDGGDYFDFVRTTAEGVVESISLYSSNDADYSTITSLSAVTDNGTGENGTGAIVSKIEKSGSAINVTRRALEYTDLPDPELELTDALCSAVRVNPKGIITAGGNSIEWGTAEQNEPSDLLMPGGLFFELVE